MKIKQNNGIIIDGNASIGKIIFGKNGIVKIEGLKIAGEDKDNKATKK